MHNNTFNLIKPVQSEFVMPQPQSMPQHHHHQQQQLYNHQPAHFQQHNMPHNPQSSPAAAPPPIIINSNNNSTCSSSTTPNTDQQQHQQHHQTSSSSPSGLLTSKPLTPPTSTMTSNPVAGGNSSSSSASSVVNLSSSLASSKSIDSTGSTSNLLAAAFNLGRKHHSNNLSQQQATTTTAHLVCKMKIPSASDQSATGNDISAGVGLTQASLTVSDIPSVMVSLFSQFSKKLLERVDKSDKKIEQVSENLLKEIFVTVLSDTFSRIRKEFQESRTEQDITMGRYLKDKVKTFAKDRVANFRRKPKKMKNLAEPSEYKSSIELLEIRSAELIDRIKSETSRKRKYRATDQEKI